MSKTKLEWHKFPAEWMAVEGFGWWDEVAPSLIRLPRRMKKKVREPVWNLAQQPAGGRIRFRTDSTHVGLRARSPDTQVMDHITRYGQMGYDIYLEGDYHSSMCPQPDGRTSATVEIAGPARLREVSIYLPLYKPARVSAVGLDAGAKVLPPKSYRRKRPVVIYGTSITHGGCASNTGMAWPAILGRMLNLDTINLGFSGNGLSEPELAEALVEVEAECYILDQWANMTIEGIEQRYDPFLDLLRQARPSTPIIVVGPFAFNPATWREVNHTPKRKLIQQIVKRRRRAGDRNLTFFDGLKQIAPGEFWATVDGIHCNTLGFYKQAEALRPHVARVLGM